uniref:Uncharacterized protein n=1 Tax=viral metagenome TaxID=1070528 RepID=A0A6H2A1X0_9ZZZZ
MAMNKKLYKRIIKLHEEGLSRLMTIKLFITMAKNENDAAEAIEEFYTTVYRKELKHWFIGEALERTEDDATL